MLYLLINYHVSVCSIMEFYSEKKSLKPLLISLQSQGYDFQAVHLQAHFYAMLVQIFTQKKKPHHSHKGDTNLDSKFFPSHRSFVSLFAYKPSTAPICYCVCHTHSSHEKKGQAYLYWFHMRLSIPK